MAERFLLSSKGWQKNWKMKYSRINQLKVNNLFNLVSVKLGFVDLFNLYFFRLWWSLWSLWDHCDQAWAYEWLFSHCLGIKLINCLISVHLMVGYSCPGEIIVIRLVTRLNYSVMGFELVRLYSLLSPVDGVAKNQGRRGRPSCISNLDISLNRGVDISLNRGVTHCTLGLRPCIISSFLSHITLPLSKLPSCVPAKNVTIDK